MHYRKISSVALANTSIYKICIYQFMPIFVLFKQRSDAATGWTLVLYIVCFAPAVTAAALETNEPRSVAAHAVKKSRVQVFSTYPQRLKLVNLR
jgi:hypothetical protein